MMKKLFAVVALALLASCATPEKPRTPKETLVYAVATHSGLVKSTSTAIDLKAVTPDEGRQAYTLLEQVRIGFDATRSALGGCVDANGQKITQVPGLAPTPVSAPGSVPLAIIQAVSCNPSTTPLDQLVIANSLLTRLALYYQTKGVQ
jgi:hypothetical protein